MYVVVLNSGSSGGGVEATMCPLIIATTETSHGITSSLDLIYTSMPRV